MLDQKDSNRPFTTATRLGEVIAGCPVIFSGFTIGSIKRGDNDLLDAVILAACPRDRVKYLMALYDEIHADKATRAAFSVIAFSKNLFGKAITKSDEGRGIVCNILRGVREGMELNRG